MSLPVIKLHELSCYVLVQVDCNKIGACFTFFSSIHHNCHAGLGQTEAAEKVHIMRKCIIQFTASALHGYILLKYNQINIITFVENVIITNGLKHCLNYTMCETQIVNTGSDFCLILSLFMVRVPARIHSTTLLWALL